MSILNFLQHIRRFEKLDGKHWLEIRRRVNGQDVSVYGQPIRCWINPRSKDNPDPQIVMSQPVTMSLEIYTFAEIDVRNNDFLIVQKSNAAGQVFGSWRGKCGEPFKYEPFQIVNMQMITLGNDGISPMQPPSPDRSMVYVHFMSNEGVRIRDSIIHSVERGERVQIPHLELDVFEFDHIAKDGKKLNADEVDFTAKASVYNITFFYSGSRLPITIKPLVDSAFMQADGNSGNGLHLYKNIPVKNVSEKDGLLEVELASGASFEHSSTFRKLTLTKLMDSANVNIVVTYPMMGWYKVAEVIGGKLKLAAYEPSENELAAYAYPI